MPKKEISKRQDLSIVEQFNKIMPEIEKMHQQAALKTRVWKIYSSMGEFDRSHAEKLWPTDEREDFIEKLLKGDSETLKILEEMEKRWID